jgi:hypothetical protein
MAKIGYIMATAHYEKLEADREWMQEYGCVKVIERMTLTKRTVRCGNS